LNRQAVVIGSFKGVGTVDTFNKAGKVITSLSATTSDSGTISTFNNEGKKLTILSATTDGNGTVWTMSNTGKTLVSLTADTGGGMINVHNTQDVLIATLQGNKYNDGMILLKDRYGNTGWGQTGKQ